MNTLTSHPSNLSDPAIFIDESGSIGSNIDYNKNNPFFIYGFCYCKNPKIMGEKLKSELYMCKQNSIYPPKLNEIKFYPTKLCDLGYTNKEIKSDWEPHYHTIRIKVLEIINKYSDGVYVGILDKNNLDWNTKKPKDVEYQFFKQILFEHILPKIDSKISIIFDKGRLNKKKKKIFDDYKSYYKNTLTPNQCIRSVDSTLTPQIWASDVIAGAFQHKYQKGESAYVNELKNIQVEKFVNIK